MSFLILGLAFAAMIFETGNAVYTWSKQADKEQRYTIVIDPGPVSYTHLTLPTSITV